MGIQNRSRSLDRAALGFVAALVFLLGISAETFAQANFYQGKNVTVVVGSAPGGLYDLWGRLLARVMGKYIPGNPNMLVQNMRGLARSLRPITFTAWPNRTV